MAETGVIPNVFVGSIGVKTLHFIAGNRLLYVYGGSANVSIFFRMAE